MDNVRVVVVQMPPTVKAYTICKDDFYTIVLNDAISYEERMKSYNHEIAHIQNNDFDKKCSADIIEIKAHRS